MLTSRVMQAQKDFISSTYFFIISFNLVLSQFCKTNNTVIFFVMLLLECRCLVLSTRQRRFVLEELYYLCCGRQPVVDEYVVQLQIHFQF